MIQNEDLSSLLRQYPVFSELPPELLQRVQREAGVVSAPAGKRLIDEGSPCSAYLLVTGGNIRVGKAGHSGHEILLYRVNPGESCILTVSALLGNTSYSIQASAEKDLTAFAIPRVLFLELLQKSTPFRTFIFRYFPERISHLMGLIEDVAFRHVDERLASLLLQRPEPILATHQNLADELGTTREVVSRILEDFQERGAVRLGRKKIEILDRALLESFNSDQKK
jgi:CRP/FNR family transcriptional regulator, anaerobic regulatory protein